ncbi:hypothetical protein M406DRAFT_50137 [Cryphonectria parasitica EP155]|uniref:U1-type domain-containing protein n=1 Tax=Cryphonectria parasitica (strain ATCC 38755 / EP155) TaxID=660469 RepID=A0A9P5CJW5_CRYP1|nr:uncharacterized protein M406DRAFT_50137 [Cryphonectria parasitica EP155]KAF3761418.1 hypothetical protein M406DRAFT_50137 [Cryphonectria parasitica EP155]
MAEHWKSTPRYWCKHCATYIRDTKLERQNHEATAKHQSAVKRSLRELHRGKEQEDREKERARREIERLNGVVGGGSGGASSSSSAFGARSSRGGGAAAAAAAGGALSESERKRQAEQLALLGVSIPQEFRGDLAMAGEWSVTSTTIVEERPKDEDEDTNPEARARGIHKRERTEEEKEAEDAVKGLFKKPRQWGRDARAAGGETSEDLDALLSGGLEAEPAGNGVKQEVAADEDLPPIKQEQADGDESIPAAEISSEAVDKPDVPSVKTEDAAAEAQGGVEAPVVAFKKRKPKNIRQK